MMTCVRSNSFFESMNHFESFVSNVKLYNVLISAKTVMKNICRQPFSTMKTILKTNLKNIFENKNFDKKCDNICQQIETKQ